MAALAMLAALGGWCAATDLRRNHIGNKPCLAGLAAGLGVAWMRGGWHGAAADDAAGAFAHGLADALAAAGMGFFPFFFFYRAGALGAGDVKLITATGALCGSPLFFLHVLAWTALAGVPLALAAAARRRRLRAVLFGAARSLAHAARRPAPAGAPADEPVRVPYAAAIMLGVWGALAAYLYRGLPLPF